MQEDDVIVLIFSRYQLNVNPNGINSAHKICRGIEGLKWGVTFAPLRTLARRNVVGVDKC